MISRVTEHEPWTRTWGKYDPFSDSDRLKEIDTPILIAVKRLLWLIVIGFWLVGIWILIF